MEATVKNIEDWRDTILKAETMKAFKMVHQLGLQGLEFPEDAIEKAIDNLIK